MELTVQEINTIAEKFRYAVDYAREKGAFDGDRVIDRIEYPKACCQILSELLGRYLHEMGFETLCNAGQYGNGWTAQNHAWLETYNGTVIDITRDQFYDRDDVLHWEKKVYVGPRDYFWEAFKKDIHKGGLVPWDQGIDSSTRLQKNFERRYDIIMKYIEIIP